MAFSTVKFNQDINAGTDWFVDLNILNNDGFSINDKLVCLKLVISLLIHGQPYNIFKS